MALWRRFGGAAAVRLPHFAPTDSPRKTLQSQCSHAKTHSAAPPTPFSVSRVPFVLRRDRHKETHKPEVNPQSPITARQPENARMAITTHGGTGTQPPASRPVWRYAANSRRDRTQNAAIEPYTGREPSTKRDNRTASPRRPAPRPDMTNERTIPTGTHKQRAHTERTPSANRPDRTTNSRRKPRAKPRDRTASPAPPRAPNRPAAKAGALLPHTERPVEPETGIRRVYPYIRHRAALETRRSQRGSARRGAQRRRSQPPTSSKL